MGRYSTRINVPEIAGFLAARSEVDLVSMELPCLRRDTISDSDDFAVHEHTGLDLHGKLCGAIKYHPVPEFQ